MPITKIERNYLQAMTLADARLWFRYRCQIIENIKGNRLSQWENRMDCRHCTSGENETQEHLEKCTFFSKYRECLDLTIREHKLIFWRRVTHTLKDIKDNNKDSTDDNTSVIIQEHENNDTVMGAHVSETYPQGQLHALPVPDRETCPRGCEGPRTYAGVAISARDISVDEMITYHPP